MKTWTLHLSNGTSKRVCDTCHKASGKLSHGETCDQCRKNDRERRRANREWALEMIRTAKLAVGQ